MINVLIDWTFVVAVAVVVVMATKGKPQAYYGGTIFIVYAHINTDE